MPHSDHLRSEQQWAVQMVLEILTGSQKGYQMVDLKVDLKVHWMVVVLKERRKARHLVPPMV